MTPLARGLLLLVVAIVLATGAAFLARSWLTNERSQMASNKNNRPGMEQQVLVAKENLPAGLIVNESHFRWLAWPKSNIPKTYMLRPQTDVGELSGAVVRRGLPAGTPITPDHLVKPGDRGFMAAVLSPGLRAVSVAVSTVSGVAGFIAPGDRVDMILTHEVPEGGRMRKASETVLANIRILAIDQKTNDQKSAASPAKTVTIEVTPRQAEQVAVLRQLGTLSFSLRPLPNEQLTAGESLDEDPLPQQLNTYTLESDVSKLVDPASGQRDGNKVTVIRGISGSTVTFGRGAEEDGSGASGISEQSAAYVTETANALRR